MSCNVFLSSVIDKRQVRRVLGRSWHLHERWHQPFCCTLPHSCRYWNCKRIRHRRYRHQRFLKDLARSYTPTHHNYGPCWCRSLLCSGEDRLSYVWHTLLMQQGKRSPIYTWGHAPVWILRKAYQNDGSAKRHSVLPWGWGQTNSDGYWSRSCDCGAYLNSLWQCWNSSTVDKI